MLMAACSPKAGFRPPPDGPFIVSDYFAASGAMGDGATPGNLTIHQDTNCKERPPGARGSCFSFEYVDKAPYTAPVSHSSGVCGWSGLFWQYPVNNWGTAEGLPIPTNKLTKVAFQVAIGSGTESVNFQIGGVGTPPSLDGSPGVSPPGACPPAETPPPPHYDLIKNALEAAQVGSDWQKVEISIAPLEAGSPLPASVPLIGAFAWSIDGTSTPLPKKIYVDDLVYE